jgi:hypothetical protein
MAEHDVRDVTIAMLAETLKEIARLSDEMRASVPHCFAPSFAAFPRDDVLGWLEDISGVRSTVATASVPNSARASSTDIRAGIGGVVSVVDLHPADRTESAIRSVIARCVPAMTLRVSRVIDDPPPRASR